MIRNTTIKYVRKHFSNLFFFLFVCNICYSQGNFKIKIIFPHKDSLTSVKLFRDGYNINKDTSLTCIYQKTSYGYLIQGFIPDKFQFVILNVYFKKTNTLLIPFFIKQSIDMKIEFNELNEKPLFHNIPFAKEFREFEDAISIYQEKLILCNRFFNSLNTKIASKNLLDSIDYQVLQNKENIRTITKTFIRSNKTKYISLFYFYNKLLATSKYNLDTLNYYYDLLSNNVEGGVEYTKVPSKIASLNSMSIGNKMMDFCFVSSDSMSYDIKAILAKSNLLICFWASWCGPCIKEIPIIKSIYEKYHSKGLDILSISIDNSKLYWIKSLKSLEMPWKQTILDNIKEKNEFEKFFKISFIPQIFLVTKDSSIIYYDIQINDDDKLNKLNQLLKNIYK